jgi:ATP-dependent DNA ligase
MLASTYDKIDRIEFPCYAQHKMDGMRCNIVIEKGEVIVYSRNGKEMSMFNRFDPLAKLIDDVVLDGELLVKRDGVVLPRQEGNGLCRHTITGKGQTEPTVTKEEAKEFYVTLWDIIPIHDWKKKVCEQSYVVRWGNLTKLPKHKLIDLVSTTVIKTIDEAQELFQNVRATGGEGLILKNKQSIWKAHRSPQHIKLKESIEMDLEVVEQIEGTGKYVGMLGKYECKNLDGSILVGVGTGYDDDQRREYWKEKHVGDIITVKYNAVITKRDSNIKSLFLPVFIEHRPDKEVADK